MTSKEPTEQDKMALAIVEDTVKAVQGVATSGLEPIAALKAMAAALRPILDRIDAL